MIIKITADGEALREKALEIPKRMRGCIDLSPEEAKALYALLHKVLNSL